jgi:hypothetical protein
MRDGKCDYLASATYRWSILCCKKQSPSAPPNPIEGDPVHMDKGEVHCAIGPEHQKIIDTFNKKRDN